jgi:hypothetical protein
MHYLRIPNAQRQFVMVATHCRNSETRVVEQMSITKVVKFIKELLYKCRSRHLLSEDHRGTCPVSKETTGKPSIQPQAAQHLQSVCKLLDHNKQNTQRDAQAMRSSVMAILPVLTECTPFPSLTHSAGY